MSHDLIDLRSDTVTKPSPGMLEAMTRAELGDDVFGDDPTVIRLQERVADLLGKEAAMFVPSGTMGNQTALRALTEPGDEIIAHRDSHIIHYESGGPAALSGCMISVLDGERGLFTADAVRAAIRPEYDHHPVSKVVTIENTHNRGGGSIWPLERIVPIHDLARRHHLRMHLDGARLLNACVATQHNPREYTQYFDTVSICFSKGLGAPVGSAVAGPRDVIHRVHRFRKMFGGAMRQAGLLAAAALYALEHNVERLAEDHANARRLAEGIAGMPHVSIRTEHVETNLVFFEVDPARATGPALCEEFQSAGVWMLPESPHRLRAVAHLDVSTDQIDRAIQIMHRVLAK